MKNGAKKINVQISYVKLFLNIEVEKSLKSKIKQFKFVIVFAMKCSFYSNLLKVKTQIQF